MDKDFVKGIKIAFGFLFTIFSIFGLVYAVGFHTANEVLGGTFLGNYSFSGNVNFTDSTVIGLPSSSVPAGAVMAFNLSSCPSGWSPMGMAEGRVIIGVGNYSQNSDDDGSNPEIIYNLNDVGGRINHILTESEMPSHDHGDNTYFFAGGSGGWYFQSSGIYQLNSFGFYSRGNDQPHENRPPYLALLYCVKN